MATRGGTEEATARSLTVRALTSRRPAPSGRDSGQLRTITARLSLTGSALARLLSVSGSQTDFILASADGSTTVQVRLAVTAVPDGEHVLGGERVLLDWSRSTIAHGARRACMSRMELRLLAALMEFAPREASREALASRLWPARSTRNAERDNALSVWIFALRRRFAAIGVPDAIRTVRGVGYYLRI